MTVCFYIETMGATNTLPIHHGRVLYTATMGSKNTLRIRRIQSLFLCRLFTPWFYNFARVPAEPSTIHDFA